MCLIAQTCVDEILTALASEFVHTFYHLRDSYIDEDRASYRTVLPPALHNSCNANLPIAGLLRGDYGLTTHSSEWWRGGSVGEAAGFPPEVMLVLATPGSLCMWDKYQ